MIAQQPGDDIVGGDALRIVAAVDDHLERPAASAATRRERALEVVRQRLVGQGGEGGDGAAGGGRIGGVGLDQDLRLVAARRRGG